MPITCLIVSALQLIFELFEPCPVSALPNIAAIKRIFECITKRFAQKCRLNSVNTVEQCVHLHDRTSRQRALETRLQCVKADGMTGRFWAYVQCLVEKLEVACVSNTKNLVVEYIPKYMEAMTESLVSRERRFDDLDHKLSECAYSHHDLIGYDKAR